MIRVRRRRRGQVGFTLIELMISLVMFSFAVAGILAVAVAMASGFREQKQSIGAESSARGGMGFLGDAIRGASPGLPGGNSLTLETFNTTSGNCPAGAFLLADPAGGTDDLTVVFAYGSVVTSTRQAFDAGTDTSLDVVDGSQFRLNDWILVTNYGRGHVVQITAVTGNNLTIATGSCTKSVVSSYNAGALVVRVLRARFYIQALDLIPTLFMDPDAEGPAAGEPLAEGVEDMQLELGVDPAGDGVSEVKSAANDDEWSGNYAGDSVPLPTDIIRAVRLTLIARSTAPVTGIGNFFRPAAANHTASLLPDNFRRRVLFSTIEVRNLGGSP